MQYDDQNLIIHPDQDPLSPVIVQVTPEQAGWEYIHFQARRLAAGQAWEFASKDCEMALVVLGGSLRVASNRGEWPRLGRRPDVFSGFPEALYLPPSSTLRVEALLDSEFALAWVPAQEDHPVKVVRQGDIQVEIRGGDNVTRQINSILPPGSGCQRLVVVEVYTPGGNWSSYPPHKHDVHRQDEHGSLIEADLEEIYYYKIDRPDGYAYQRVYTGPDSPLQRAGTPIEALLLVRNNDLVLVPEGYHPVVSAPGYTTYYLNVLAGSAQSLTASDDPRYAWVKGTYRERDSRVPLFTLTADR